jgi:hypothetical protein
MTSLAPFSGGVTLLGTFRDVSSFSCSDGLGRLVCGWGDCAKREVAFLGIRISRRKSNNREDFMVVEQPPFYSPFFKLFLLLLIKRNVIASKLIPTCFF